MSKARARRATSRPILPRPTIASVLPRSSPPTFSFRFHSPLRVVRSARAMWRELARIMANVCSHAEIVLPSGVFMTSDAGAVEASASMLSTPTPARAIALSCLAVAMASP